MDEEQDRPDARNEDDSVEEPLEPDRYATGGLIAIALFVLLFLLLHGCEALLGPIEG